MIILRQSQEGERLSPLSLYCPPQEPREISQNRNLLPVSCPKDSIDCTFVWGLAIIKDSDHETLLKGLPFSRSWTGCVFLCLCLILSRILILSFFLLYCLNNLLQCGSSIPIKVFRIGVPFRASYLVILCL